MALIWSANKKKPFISNLFRHVHVYKYEIMQRHSNIPDRCTKEASKRGETLWWQGNPF